MNIFLFLTCTSMRIHITWGSPEVVILLLCNVFETTPSAIIIPKGSPSLAPCQYTILCNFCGTLSGSIYHYEGGTVSNFCNLLFTSFYGYGTSYFTVSIAQVERWLSKTGEPHRIWPRKYWLTIFELIYSTIELSARMLIFLTHKFFLMISHTVGVMVVYMSPGSAYFLANPPITFILLFGCSLTLTIFTGAAFVCLLREVGYYPAVGIWSPYDFLAGYPNTFPRRWSLVFGAFTTKQRFRCVFSDLSLQVH